MAMKVVRQARLELSGGSTPDQLRPPAGDGHFNILLVNIHYGGLCCPSVTHGLALVSHYFKSITCVCSVILQSTLDAFLRPNPVVTDSTADNVQLTSSPSPPVEGTTLCLGTPSQSPRPPLGNRHSATASRETVT